MDSLRSIFPLAILLMLAVPAGAQHPAKAPNQGKPALNADAFKLPPSAYDAGKFDYTAPQRESGGFAPGRFDLGDSMLQLNTKRQVPDTRVGIEAMDPKSLGGLRKDEPTLPNYFGMTLTRPLD
ncbi:MAG: hypothetical protein ACK4UO_04380 [Pseudolabrys sp.]